MHDSVIKGAGISDGAGKIPVARPYCDFVVMCIVFIEEEYAIHLI